MTRWLTAAGFSPHLDQEGLFDAFLAGHRFLVVICGRRWGKTLSMALLAGYAFIQQDTRVWVVSKTYELAKKVWAYVVPILTRLLGGSGLEVLHGEMKIRAPWGAELCLKSADHPDSLIGEGVDLLIVDEAATLHERIWQMYLRPTLTDREGSAIFISTPRGFNWLWRLFDLGQRGESGYWSMCSPSDRNPFLSVDELRLARQQTDPILWRQEYEAQFIVYAGQVYGLFSRDMHILPEAGTDLTGWPVCVAVDPGLNNPSAILWIAQGPDDQDIIVREHIASNMLFPDVHRLLKQHEPPGGYKALVCDIAGKARSQETGSSFIGWMGANGYQFTARASGIVAGVNLVRSRLNDMNGVCHLRVLDACPLTVAAFENYHYPEPREGQAQPEEPEKDGVNDHPMDALRYYMVWRMAPQSQVWRY